jgi:N-acetylglutamate synthase-like GNAT family acetyltransferase
MVEIIHALDYAGGFSEAARYIHSKWGSPRNFVFYEDAVRHSSRDALQQFYLLMRDERIIGCAALLTNDLISRGDLCPWLAALYVEEDERCHGFGGMLLEHGIAQAKKMGYQHVYLATDHDGYYERYGWVRGDDAFQASGERSRVYSKSV